MSRLTQNPHQLDGQTQPQKVCGQAQRKDTHYSSKTKLLGPELGVSVMHVLDFATVLSLWWDQSAVLESKVAQARPAIPVLSPAARR